LDSVGFYNRQSGLADANSLFLLPVPIEKAENTTVEICVHNHNRSQRIGHFISQLGKLMDVRA
jgi:hypothetical protein